LVARHHVPLAGFLARAHPKPVLRKDILDRHAERRVNPGERIDHEPDQRSVVLSSSAHASAGSSTGVCPDVTTCRGPRTDLAGLTGTTWPVTSQSNGWRIAASRCLTLGAYGFPRKPSIS
jgi:hypothetical protein